ncbi:TPA: hypothetical protein ACXNQV_001587 [Stenotrophomonas maltophilia]
MFFWLKEEANIAGVMPDLANYVECLENLGEAGFRKHHLVLGDRSMLVKILDLDISKKARAYFGSVVTKYATIGGLSRDIRRVFVSTGCHAAVEDAGWTVPLTSFADVDSLAPTILVVEHMHDFDVMSGLTDLHLMEGGLSSLVSLKLFPSAGGGGGAHLSISTYQRDARSLGLCVLDSDRAHVLAALGTTARTCSNAFVSSWRWRMHVLQARELENVIPPGVIKQAGLDYHFKSEGYYHDGVWPISGYADLKLGDSLCRFHRVGVGEQSFEKTAAALAAHFSNHADCGEAICLKPECYLCTPRGGVVARVAEHARSGALRRLRRIPERVAALNDLVSDIAFVGAAAAWRII